MTSTPLDITHRRMVALALPMTLAHVTVPLLGLTDATAIGRLGEAHLLGAVALGAIVFDFLFWSFGALRMGTAGLTAQALGAGDGDEIDRALKRALLIGFIVGAILVALQMPIRLGASLLSGASPAVLEAFNAYFTIRIWAAPFTLMNYALLGSLIGRGRTDWGLIVQVAMNLLNVVLTLLFVLHFEWGIAGAALGTAIAEAAGVAMGLTILCKIGGARPWRPLPGLFERTALRRTLSVNTDIMIRTMALLTAFVLFTRQGAKAGDVTLAANAVLYNLFLVGGFFLDGFATAAETLCGQAFGARRARAFAKAARLALIWCVAFGAALALVFWFAGPVFIDVLSNNPAVRAFARDYLIFAALTPLIGAPAFAYDGIYTGASWTASMRNLMLIALGCFTVSLFLIDFGNANHGLWTAFLIFLGARSLGQAALYRPLFRRSFSSPEPIAGTA